MAPLPLLRKLKASASKHKVMSYKRMAAKEKQLQEEVTSCWRKRRRPTPPKTPSMAKENAEMNYPRSWRGGRVD
jgi:hypothetical protein